MIKQVRSFFCAFRGLWLALKQPHMRFHLVACGYVLYFSRFYNFSKAEYSALFLVTAMVMSSECINTALEQLSDRVTTKREESIRNVKDIAAGAVLICAIAAIALAVLLFWQPDVLSRIITYHLADPMRWILLLASALVSILFVWGQAFSKRKDNNND